MFHYWITPHLEKYKPRLYLIACHSYEIKSTWIEESTVQLNCIPSTVTCKKCRETEVYKQDLITFDLGFESEPKPWLEYIYSVDRQVYVTYKCASCKGAAHPDSGCYYGPNTLICGPCTRKAWKWIQGHTNSCSKRVGPKGSKQRVYFYDHSK